MNSRIFGAVNRFAFGVVLALLAPLAGAYSITNVQCGGANCPGPAGVKLDGAQVLDPFAQSGTTLELVMSTAGSFVNSFSFTTDAPTGSLFAVEWDLASVIDTGLTVKLNGIDVVTPEMASSVTNPLGYTTSVLLLNGFNTLVIMADAAVGTFAGYKVTLTAVPLPAAAWLFISALAGLVVVGRRRQMLASAS